MSSRPERVNCVIPYYTLGEMGLMENVVVFRKERLHGALDLQQFKANQRLLLELSVKQRREMKEKGLPKSRSEADKLLVEHQDWKVRTRGVTI